MFTIVFLIPTIIGAIIGLLTHDRLWFPALSEYILSAMLGAWLGAMIGFTLACIFVGIPQ
jgi:glycerol uptake facilitator-like aquaporin